MNKYLLLLLILFSFSACEKERMATAKYIYDIVNTTNQTIVFEVKTDVGEKSVQIIGNSEDSVVIEKSDFRTDDGGVTIYGGDGDPTNALLSIDVFSECIFVLSDTASYCWNGENEAADIKYIESIEILIDGTAWNVENYYKINISDDLINEIAEKDYTMLEKFPEYYGKQE